MQPMSERSRNDHHKHDVNAYNVEKTQLHPLQASPESLY